MRKSPDEISVELFREMNIKPKQQIRTYNGRKEFLDAEVTTNEQDLQIKVCNFLKQNYPDVIFFSEPSGLYLKSWKQKKALKAMRSVGKLPDLFIARASGRYFGLFLELKKKGTVLFKKDGGLKKDEHIQKQFETLKALEAQGYKAVFSVGFEESAGIITAYLNKKKISRL